MKLKERSVEASEKKTSTIYRFFMTLYWRYRRILAILAIPIFVIICILAFSWIPISEAKHQQKELANTFFDECYVTFVDTSQIPKMPEEALAIAQRKQKISLSALRTWSPQVSGEIRNGYWWAKIQFMSPTKHVFEKRIGVAVNDVGYNTPSERSQRLRSDWGEQ